MDWVKKRKMSPADQILTLLAISRFIKLWIAYSYWWVLESYPSLWVNAKGVRSVSVIFTIVNHFSIWLATILSIFYFLKIANFSQSIFFYLKGRAKKVISAIQLVSLILLIVTTIVLDIQIDAYMDEYKRNVSYSFNSRDSAELLQIILFTNFEFTLIPFTVSLAACLLLIFSLWKHLKQMQRHSTGSRDASTMAHVKALQSVVAFLLLITSESLLPRSSLPPAGPIADRWSSQALLDAALCWLAFVLGEEHM
ncbi:taste receptor type 2 member 140-like [Ctenodactylus gundi]